MLRNVSSSRARTRRGLRIVAVVAALGLVMPAAGAVPEAQADPERSPSGATS